MVPSLPSWPRRAHRSGFGRAGLEHVPVPAALADRSPSSPCRICIAALSLASHHDSALTGGSACFGVQRHGTSGALRLPRRGCRLHHRERAATAALTLRRRLQRAGRTPAGAGQRLGRAVRQDDRPASRPGPFYNDLLSVSTKTTFDAVTHALMTIQLTDAQSASLGDALALVERVESRAWRSGRRGRRSAVSDLRAALSRRADDAETVAAVQAQRGQRRVPPGISDELSGTGRHPSVQISIALDGRRADVDVDYRRRPSHRLFNGHLTASNSDVRAGTTTTGTSPVDRFPELVARLFGVTRIRPEAAASAAPALPNRHASVGSHRRHGQRFPAGVAGRVRRRRAMGSSRSAPTRAWRRQRQTG